MPQENEVEKLIINKLTKEQYKNLVDKSKTEIYDITDDEHYTADEMQGLLDKKQDKLTAGKGLEITADNVINNTQTSAEWGNITGDITTQTDLKTALDLKADDNNVVHISTDETINDVKTFTDKTIFNGGTGGSIDNPSIEVKNHIITGGTDVTTWSGLQSNRKCNNDNGFVNTAGFIVNSDGTAKISHKRGTETEIGVGEDAYLTLDAEKLIYAKSDIKGNSSTTEYEVYHSGNLVAGDNVVLDKINGITTIDVDIPTVLTDDITIIKDNKDTISAIGVKTKSNNVLYEWVGTKDEYDTDFASGKITSNTECLITDDEQELIGSVDINVPTKLSELANDTNFISTIEVDNLIDEKIGDISSDKLVYTNPINENDKSYLKLNKNDIKFSNDNTIQSEKSLFHEGNLTAGENVEIVKNGENYTINASGGTNVLVDEATIIKDDRDIITTIGVKSKTNEVLYDWIGTQEEYEAGLADGTISPEWICWITDDNKEYSTTYGSDIALLDIIVSNQILEGVDKIGKEFQGSLIFKSIYPDAYAKLLKYYNTSVDTTEIVEDIEVSYKQCTNDWKILDISNKNIYDQLFEKTGSANYFVLDIENELFYLPKTNNILQPNASNSNPIYGKSSTVQQQSNTVYIYYKVGNTIQSNATQIEDVTLNNPFSLFESKYSDIPLNNLSWIKSEGQFNSGEIYSTQYEKLLIEHNPDIEIGTVLPNGYIKKGLPVKSNLEVFDDFDFVINENEHTFRLPLKNGFENLPGDTHYNILTDIDWNSSTHQDYTLSENGSITAIATFSVSTPNYPHYVLLANATSGERIFSINGSSQVNGQCGTTLSGTKGQIISIFHGLAGYITKFEIIFSPFKGNGSLYYYIGETVQNVNLINTIKILDEQQTITDKIETERLIQNRLYEGVDLTKKFATEIEKFSDEWAWIKDRVTRGDYSGLYIGDYIPVTISAGTAGTTSISQQTLKCQIAGIDTYANCTDNDIKHHIDFISKECIDSPIQWCTTNNNNGTSVQTSPWLASIPYAWLNGINNLSTSAYNNVSHGINANGKGIYQLLPEKLKEQIIEKRQLLDNRYSASGLLTSSTAWEWKDMGKLWLPNETEVYGTQVRSNITQTSGWWNPEAQSAISYPIYLGSGRNRVKMNSNGTRVVWWLSSVDSHSSTVVCAVNSYGYASGYRASSSYCCPLCFRI